MNANRLSGGLAGALVALAAFGVVLALFGQDADAESRSSAIGYLPLLISAVLLLWHRPQLPITWALSVMAAAWALAFLNPLLEPLREGDGFTSTLFDAAIEATWPLTFPLIPLVLTLFPSPPTSRAGRLLLRVELGSIAFTMLLMAVDADEGEPLWLFRIGQVVLIVGVLGAGVLAVARLVVVRRSASGRERAQVSLVLAAGLAVVGLYVVGGMLTLVLGPSDDPGWLSSLDWFLVVGAVPSAIAVALLRHRLYGVELVVNRALVWLALVAFVVAGAVLLTDVVAGMLGRTAPDPVLVVLPCLVVAAGALPLRRVLQRGADALVPAVDEDRRALGALTVRLDRALPAERVPEVIVEAIGEGVGLKAVRLMEDTDEGPVRLAEWGGETEGHGATVPLRHAGAVVGSLEIWPEPDDRRRELITNLAGHAAVALHASRLTRELERSRERLVWGREEERRRLRQDLHDELSPSLSGIRLAVAAARSRGVPAGTDPLLARAQDEAAGAVDVIRQILDDLRPPALDELGLVGAVRRRAESLTRPGEFEVTVVDSGLPRSLPPAIEVGLFRIASEAMANAARHSGAHHCAVSLSHADGSLQVAVGDDGSGLSPDHGEGVGLRSMRERSESLGGCLETENGESGGLSVTAVVPYEGSANGGLAP